MNITKRKRTNKKFNNKRGISLVVAIALSIVLCMTTAAFISIALLNQNDTGSELNTRQAYISSKGAIDMAQDMIKNGEIPVPASGEVFYVFYYDGAGNLLYKSFSTAELAAKWIKDNKDTYDIVGNCYVVVTNDGSGNCRVTAYGSEDKYTGSKKENRQRDLSKSFTVKDEYLKNTTNVPGLSYSVTPPGNAIGGAKGTDFLAVGAQTNYSLLYSYFSYYHAGSENAGASDSKYSTAGQYSNDNKSVFMIPNKEAKGNESGGITLNSQMPLVYNYCLKNTTNGFRSVYTAYDTGVYLLGDHTSPDSDYNGELKNAAYYTENQVWGVDFRCKYIVINNNIYTKQSQDSGGRISVSYSGAGSKSSVCLYAPKAITFYRYNADTKTKESSYTLPAGIYKISSGTDIAMLKTKPTTMTADDALKNYGMDKSYVDNTVLKLNAHAGYESQYDYSTNSSGIKPVSILNNDSSFQKNSDVYGTVQRTSFYNGWANYDVYCAPNFMPGMKSGESGYTGYYDMYAGDSTGGSFNYMWYNVRPMEVKDNVKMAIHSKSIVLTIGPDLQEIAGKKTVGSNTFPHVQNDGNATGLSNTKQSNRYVNGKKNSEFYLKPYWNEEGFTVNVKCDFVVNWDSNNDGTFDVSYEVKAGEYVFDSSSLTSAYKKNGINLFSTDAKNFFKNASGKSIDTKDSDIGWVDSTGKISNSVSASKLDQSSKAVDFKATSGELQGGATYKAKAIYADFSQDPLKTNGASFNASYVEISTDTLEGTSFTINTSSGNGTVFEVKRSTTKLNGTLVRFTKTTTLKNTSKGTSFEIEPGYYFFENKNDVDVLSPTVWGSGAYKLVTTGDSILVTFTPVQKVDFVGGYY